MFDHLTCRNGGDGHTSLPRDKDEIDRLVYVPCLRKTLKLITRKLYYGNKILQTFLNIFILKKN